MRQLEPPHGAFTVRQGLDAGLGRGLLRGPRFDAPFHGVREAKQPTTPMTPEERRLAEYAPQLLELRRLAKKYAPRMRDDQFYSHETALALIGAPTPEHWVPRLHVSAHRPRNGPGARAVIGHRLQSRKPAWRVIAGVRVEHPARAWVQSSTTRTHDQLVAAGDYLVLPRRGLVTIAELWAEARAMRRSALDDVLIDVREGSESFRETDLRLACLRAGLPEPELNVDIHDMAGVFIGRFDQVYRRYRVLVEYDGRQHALDQFQFERDADRWDAARNAGWDHVRILKKHLVPDPSIAVAKVRAALRRAADNP